MKYTDRSVLWAEKLRQEWLAQQGYIVIRVTWDDVVSRPGATLRRIWDAVDQAGRRPAAR